MLNNGVDGPINAGNATAEELAFYAKNRAAGGLVNVDSSTLKGRTPIEDSKAKSS